MLFRNKYKCGNQQSVYRQTIGNILSGIAPLFPLNDQGTRISDFYSHCRVMNANTKESNASWDLMKKIAGP